MGKIKAWGVRGGDFEWRRRLRVKLEGENILVFTRYRNDDLTISSKSYRYKRQRNDPPAGGEF